LISGTKTYPDTGHKTNRKINNEIYAFSEIRAIICRILRADQSFCCNSVEITMILAFFLTLARYVRYIWVCEQLIF